MVQQFNLFPSMVMATGPAGDNVWRQHLANSLLEWDKMLRFYLLSLTALYLYFWSLWGIKTVVKFGSFSTPSQMNSLCLLFPVCLLIVINKNLYYRSLLNSRKTMSENDEGRIQKGTVSVSSLWLFLFGHQSFQLRAEVILGTIDYPRTKPHRRRRWDCARVSL